VNFAKTFAKKQKQKLSSQPYLQVLVLLENVFLVCMPYVAHGLYHPLDDCFPAQNWGLAIWSVMIAWLIGAVAQCIHYKFGSPLSLLNGPSVSSWFPPDQISFLARLCWKSEIHQRLELKDLCRPQCRTKDNR
jgi:hypothetical protein